MIECPYCGHRNAFSVSTICHNCRKDMAEYVESDNSIEAKDGRHGGTSDLRRIADAVERNARATELIFLFLLISAILGLACGLLAFLLIGL